MLCITVHRLIFPELVIGAALWPGPLCASISIGEGSTTHTTSTAKEGGPNAYADAETGVASWQSSWSTSGHTFAPIFVELEDHALPPAFEVLTVTITSTPQTNSQRSGSHGAPRRKLPTASNDELELPIAQFDILLSGLGLEERWRLAAQRQRAQAIHTHAIVENEASNAQGEENQHVFEAHEQAAGKTSAADEVILERPGLRTTASSNSAVTSTTEDAVRLLKHASWERVGLHTTRAPAYPGDRESISPLPSPITPRVATEAEFSHEIDVARPKVGEGCLIDIGLSLMDADDVPPNHKGAHLLAGTRSGANGDGPSSSSTTPKQTKADKALDFFFEFEEPIPL
eukprot:COSAG02_NODE_256_length_26885_cov_54.604308_13_plen_344_part_00